MRKVMKIRIVKLSPETILVFKSQSVPLPSMTTRGPMSNSEAFAPSRDLKEPIQCAYRQLGPS